MSPTASPSWSDLQDSGFLRTEKLWQPAVPIKSPLHRTGRQEGHAATFTVPFSVNYKPQELLLQIPAGFLPSFWFPVPPTSESGAGSEHCAFWSRMRKAFVLALEGSQSRGLCMERHVPGEGNILSYFPPFG